MRQLAAFVFAVLVLGACSGEINPGVLPTTTTASTTTTVVPSTTVTSSPLLPVVPPPTEASTHYSRCSEAPGPLSEGDPGYRPELDRDDDGVACEG